jgi:hypothetical protein
MVSAVFVTGRLGKPVDSVTRFVELDRVIPGPMGEYQVDQIPVVTYGGPGCLFMKAPIGSFITVKGHLETREKLGLVVCLELEEIFPLKKKK